MMVRLVVLWCPGLSREGPRGEEARRFAAVLETATALAPFAHPVRLGVVAVPSRGPSRFFGGERAFAERLTAAVGPLLGGDSRACVGAAEGLFAGLLAARASVFVPVATTGTFLAPWSIATLRDPDLAAACQRLGLHTLGRFASLEEARVLERFGLDAVRRHRVARGLDGELPGLRDAAALRRIDALVRRDAPRDIQRGFFGERGAADLRAAAAAQRIEEQLGVGAVTVARLGGGRAPDDRAALVPWGSRDAQRAGRDAAAPWPGRIPAPSPAAIPSRPLRVSLCDAEGHHVAVCGRGLLSGTPVGADLGVGRPRTIAGHYGPWPMAERWWSAGRRRAHLQVLFDDGLAVLLRAERSEWWLAGVYD
jgi:hypothetical protein